MSSSFDVDVTMKNDRAVMAVAGELDVNTIPYIMEATDALALGQPLTLDLSGVTFMDSSALNMLLILRDRAHTEGGMVELRKVTAQTLRLLERTGTRPLFSL
ncbi:STAS domain-containing protein [Streptomyces sp. NPDC060334]|uniref:STAS domain-containing protein n=1 Tax=Streptomyces sp. NPDC060334 TaxID=3347099 RepID=UPI0036649CDB